MNYEKNTVKKVFAGTFSVHTVLILLNLNQNKTGMGNSILNIEETFSIDKKEEPTSLNIILYFRLPSKYLIATLVVQQFVLIARLISVRF